MKVIFVLLVATLLPACASMFGDNSDPVNITSEPPGAEVYFRGELLGTTPLQTRLPRRAEATSLVFKLNGYNDKSVMAGRAIDGVAFFNFGFTTTTTGATSWGVDALSGKLWRYSPHSYVVKMEKTSADLWNDEVFNYVINNGSELIKDVARAGGPTWDGFCKVRTFEAKLCANFMESARAQQDSVISAGNSLDLYRQLTAINPP